MRFFPGDLHFQQFQDVCRPAANKQAIACLRCIVPGARRSVLDRFRAR